MAFAGRFTIPSFDSPILVYVAVCMDWNRILFVYEVGTIGRSGVVPSTTPRGRRVPSNQRFDQFEILDPNRNHQRNSSFRFIHLCGDCRAWYLPEKGFLRLVVSYRNFERNTLDAGTKALWKELAYHQVARLSLTINKISASIILRLFN